MRTAIAALGAALLYTVLVVPTVGASPAEVNVRIEGRSETLFEGPILTDGHKVRASSDSSAPPGGRRCNGLNNGQNPTPGPTPTAASVDAMGILGEGFDGRWYAEPFEDYFITRWGPDGQDEGNGEFWGLLVNDVFAGVGGCQYELDGGDEVVWVYDAFKDRPILALFPADYGGGSKQLTATAVLHQPFEVEVDAYEDHVESTPPASPQRTGAVPLDGAEVAPVVTGPGGFERVDTSDAQTVTTDADGLASIVFDEPGWHRIKATVAGSGGEEGAVRSNRLDVCVPDPPAAGCGALPPDDLVRIPPAVQEEPDEGEGADGGDPGPVSPGRSAGASAPAVQSPGSAIDPVRLHLLGLDRRRLSQGLVGVRWRVLDSGPGIRSWAISTRTLGRKRARYVARATGARGTSASLRLPPGAYRLRLTVVDALGRSATAQLGSVRVPG